MGNGTSNGGSGKGGKKGKKKSLVAFIIQTLQSSWMPLVVMGMVAGILLFARVVGGPLPLNTTHYVAATAGAVLCAVAFILVTLVVYERDK